MSALRRRLFREDGQAAVELMGTIWFLLLCALLGWQLLLVTASVTAAENAARNGSRAASMTVGSPTAVAIESLPPWLASGATATGSHHMRVTVQVPIVAPGFRSDAFRITRQARLPDTRQLPVSLP